MTSTNQTILIVMVIVALLAFRIYRQTREQRWSIVGMWIAPAIFLAITVILVAIDTQRAWLAPVAGVIGLAGGLAIGLYQGNHTTLRIDKPNKVVHVKVSPVGTLMFVAILVLRIGYRFVMLGGIDPQAIAKNGAPPIPPVEAVISSLLLALAAGTIAGLRLYVQRQYDAARDA